MPDICPARRAIACGVLSLFVCSPVAHAVDCNNQLSLTGYVVSIDEALGQISVQIHAVTTFATDVDTQFKGGANSVADFVIGELAEVRYCVIGNPWTAVRLEPLGSPFPGNVNVIDLDVPFGAEATPVMRVFGDDQGERFGGGSTDAIAFGDINGDGFDDMIVGAYTRDQPVSGAGAVDVIYGGPGSPTSVIDLNTDGMVSEHGETRLLPNAGSQLMGYAVASGDIDGDGFDDVVIGSISGASAGQVHIVFGAAQLPGTSIGVDTNAAAQNQTLIFGQGLSEQTGASLATGDVNGDGRDDVIIGAPGQTAFSANLGGTVFVVYGDAALRGATLNLDTDDTISNAGETRILGAGDGDATGRSVASGDVNGDGFVDIVIGAPLSNALLTTDRGVLYVIYGSEELPGTIVDLADTTNGIGPAGETRVWARATNNWLGSTVATGDINGDGFDDVIAGAPGITGAGDNFAVGEIYVIYGSATLPASIVDLRTPPGTFGETQITGTEEFGGLAKSVAAADINGDGYDDLVMGATGAMPPGTKPEFNTVEDGALYVLFGGPALQGQHLVDIRAHADIVVLADNFNDRWGATAEAGGDLNRDGVPEYAAAASTGDNPFGGGNGVVAVFGQTMAAAATRVRHSTAGDAPAGYFGPVVRAVVDFHSGNQVSTDTARVMRSAAPGQPGGGLPTLPVHWSVDTDRSSPTANLTLRYTDAELAAIDEQQLAMYTSANGATGTWVLAGTAQIKNALRNEVTALNVPAQGLFALVEDPAACGDGADTDSDGLCDLMDNCLGLSNADQRDSDADGFGNVCDADLNDDCIVNVADLGLLRSVFFSTDADADFNGDGVVNALDLAIMKLRFFQAPGPSGVANLCD